jgi:hypothetical protein
MLTWGSKYFFGLSLAAFVAAVAYAWISGGGPLGGLSFGWYQGVGDHLGYAVLMGAAVALFLLGVLSVWVRDADAEEMASLAGTEKVPQARPPVNPSYWGAVVGFGVACVAIGASVSGAFLWLGFALLFVAAMEWVVLAWTDRATGDPVANNTLRNRLMLPIEVPLFGALAIAVLVLGLSRVFLAVPAMGAVALASVLATIGFGLAIAFAYRPHWFSANAVSGIVAAFAGMILVAGVVAAAVGPREFHDYTEDHRDEQPAPDEAGTVGQDQADPDAEGADTDEEGS